MLSEKLRSNYNIIKYIFVFLTVFLFGIFVSSNGAWAQEGLLNNYDKSTNDTLRAQEWNNLVEDFLQRRGATTIEGDLHIKELPGGGAGGLTVDGFVNFVSGLNAGYITGGEFGSLISSGNFIFPEKLTIKGDGEFKKNIYLENTTSPNNYGVIYKGGEPFIHDFRDSNTFLGLNAGNFTMTAAATENTAVGRGTLMRLTTGNSNLALGYHALTSNTTGNHNLASGYAALQLNTVGNYNSALGSFALQRNTAGSYNLALGSFALQLNDTGSYNLALGYRALYSNNTGSSNIAIGYQAGRHIADGSTGRTTGDDSIFIGANTKANTNAENNQIVVGANAIGAGSNSVVLGADTITKTLLKGNVGININPDNGYRLHVKGLIRTDRDNTNDPLTTGYCIGTDCINSWDEVVGGDEEDNYWTKMTNNANNIYNKNTGNVGIGINSPAAKLDVRSPDFPVLKVVRHKTSTSGGIYGAAHFELTKTGTTLNKDGIGLYFSSQNSAGQSKFAGLIGAGLSNVTSGSEIGEFLFNASYKGEDPYLRRDFIVRATNSQASANNVDILIPKGTLIIGGDFNSSTLDPQTKLYINNGSGVAIDTGTGKIRMNANAVHNYDVINKANLDSALSTAIGDVYGDIYWNASSNNDNNIYSRNSGNVGIGTSNPGEKLEIVGKMKIGNNIVSGENITFDTSSAPALRITNQHGYVSLSPINAHWAHIYTDRGNFIFDKSIYSYGGKFSAYDTNNLELQTHGTTRLFIRASDGGVGIGTTSLAANARLTVDNAAGIAINTGSGIIKMNKGAIAGDDVVNLSTLISYLSEDTYWSEHPVNSGNIINTNLGDVTIGGILTVDSVVADKPGQSSYFTNLHAEKITVQTIDPLYQINNIKYSTFAPSIVGGVKEEISGKLKINSKVGGEYQAIIDFAQEKVGSDLWVWYNVIDFSKDNVEVIATPYGSFANLYYQIKGTKLIFKSDKPVEISYRLTANRFDWQDWPTKALDQTEKPSFIINKK